MNRKGDLLNGALLGSSGSSTKIFIQATQWCTAQTSALLHVGRGLKHGAGISGIVVTGTLRAGRKLRVYSQVVVATSVRLYGLVAVPMTPMPISIVVNTATSLRALRAVLLSVGSPSLVVNTSGVLKCIRAKPLTPSSTSLLVQTSVLLKQMRAVNLLSTNPIEALPTSGKLSRVSQMKSSISCRCLSNVLLSESSKIRAPTNRISTVSGAIRISNIQGD